ncbi:MAG TPA: alpha/beta hydrolase [Devosia sp.]|nr:alpha/beta hydrolase [Devosia sp.]
MVLDYALETAVRQHVDVPTSRMIETAVGWLEVATLGPDSGRPLILVDHAMGDWASLFHIGQELAERQPSRRIIAWSRPGCGNSPAMAEAAGIDPLVQEARVVLPALMSALGIATADFLCHSDGATMAMMFAALFPDRVGRVVAIAPYGFADSQFADNTHALPAEEYASGLTMRLGAQHADAKATYRRWRERRLSNITSGWSALDVLAGMTAPLLLIQGTMDEFNSPEQISAVAEAVSGPVNWVLLRNQGHFLQHDVPEQIVCLASGHLEPGRRPMLLHS